MERVLAGDCWKHCAHRMMRRRRVKQASACEGNWIGERFRGMPLISRRKRFGKNEIDHVRRQKKRQSHAALQDARAISRAACESARFWSAACDCRFGLGDHISLKFINYFGATVAVDFAFATSAAYSSPPRATVLSSSGGFTPAASMTDSMAAVVSGDGRKFPGR